MAAEIARPLTTDSTDFTDRIFYHKEHKGPSGILARPRAYRCLGCIIRVMNFAFFAVKKCLGIGGLWDRCRGVVYPRP